jgi:hypothetical protein
MAANSAPQQEALDHNFHLNDAKSFALCEVLEPGHDRKPWYRAAVRVSVQFADDAFRKDVLLVDWFHQAWQWPFRVQDMVRESEAIWPLLKHPVS